MKNYNGLVLDSSEAFVKSVRLVFLAGTLLLAPGCAQAQLPPTTASFGGAEVVELPYRIVHGLVVIPVSLNGSPPLQFILDTGAPVVVIRDTAVAKTLKLRIGGQVRVGGAGDGERRMAPFAVGMIARFGALEVKNVSGIVGSIEGAIPGVDGVIGGALFQNSVVEFDFDAKVVRFHNPAIRRFAMAGDSIPLRVDPGVHPFVRGTVTVNGTAMPLDLHLDTGARQALAIARTTMEKYGAKPEKKLSTIVGFGSRGEARGDIIRASKLELGRTPLAAITTVVMNNEPGGEGRIGLPVLERFHLWVDYPGQRIVLQPRANIGDPFPAQTTGLVFFPAKDSTVRVVAEAGEGTPAREAGLQRGDTLLAVNGRDLRTLDYHGIRVQLLTPSAGTRLTLTVKRGANVQEFRLVSRTLIP
jgi:predicted aspartyl protease